MFEKFLSAKDETQMDFTLSAHRWGRDENRFCPKTIAELIEKSFKLNFIVMCSRGASCPQIDM